MMNANIVQAVNMASKIQAQRCMHACMHAGRQACRQADRQASKHACLLSADIECAAVVI